MERWVDWVRSHGLVMVSPTANMPSLVRELAGEDIRGSWWSHPKANAIYNTWKDLEDHPDILSLKLLDRKITLVHRKLWPFLLVAVFDPDWRAAVAAQLSQETLALLKEVEEHDTLQLDLVSPSWPDGDQALKKARNELEAVCIVISHDVHTPSGAHTTTLESWRCFQVRSDVAPSEGIRVAEAIARLREYAHGRRLGIEVHTKTRRSAKR